MYIPFVSIENDNQAEDLITQIEESKSGMERLITVCDYEIDKYQSRKTLYQLSHEENIKNAMTMLGEYCRNKANHQTKTLISYKLPSGKLQWTKKNPKVVRDDDVLLAWMKTNSVQLVKMEIKPDWETLKKVLKERSDHYEYATPDGELIPVDGVTLVEQGEVFEVK
jgi:phage host-nuclease inhibitor protein Gam